MRAIFTVEVPDDFMHARWVESWGGEKAAGKSASSPVDYLTGRAQDVADDELPLAFFGWPVTITVEVP